MAVRKCPYCLATVPAGKVVAYSNDLECPGCQRRLEISPASCSIAIWMGLAAAAVVWRLAARPAAAGSMLGWVLPVVYAFLALSIVSPVLLMLTADLRIVAAGPATEAPNTASPRGAYH